MTATTFFRALLVVCCFTACTSALVHSVSSAKELIDFFRNSPEKAMNADIEVLNDLDFRESALTRPLGASESGNKCFEYSGVLHGNGHTIKNIEMTNTSYPHSGLFCAMKDATVENLIIDSSCSFTGLNVGVLTVSVIGSLHVKNVTTRAAVSGFERVGGFVGFIDGLRQEHTTVSFDGCTGYVLFFNGNGRGFGWFIGYIGNNTNLNMVVSNSLTSGYIRSDRDLGGFLGQSQTTRI